MTRCLWIVAVAVVLAGGFCVSSCTGPSCPSCPSGVVVEQPLTQPAASTQPAPRAAVAAECIEMRRLLVKLKSDQPSVRVQAIRALARLDHEVVLAHTRGQTMRPPPVLPSERIVPDAPLIVTGRTGTGFASMYILDPATGTPVVALLWPEDPYLQAQRTWVYEVVPALVARISDTDAGVRYAAVWALADMDVAWSDTVLAAVKNASYDSDRWVRKVATTAYTEMTRPDRLPQHARTTPYSIEEKVQWILDGHGKPADAVKLGPEALPVVLKMLRKMATFPPRLPGKDMAAMLKPFGPPALKGLAKQLVDDDLVVSHHAARVLRYIGIKAVDVLGRGLADKRAHVRSAAITGLSMPIYQNQTTGRDMPEYRQALKKFALPIGRCLTREEDLNAIQMVTVLVTYLRGEGIVAVGPALGDKRVHVRALGLTTLGRLLERRHGARFGPIPDAPETVAALAAMLIGVNADESKEALDALGALGPRAAPAAKALGKMLTHKEAKIRGQAAKILGGLGEAARPVVATLARALKDKNPAVRAKAIDALGQLGPVARAAGPALKAVTKDRDLMVAISATEALKAVQAPKARDEK